MFQPLRKKETSKDSQSFLSASEMESIRNGTTIISTSDFFGLMEFERLRLATYLLPGRVWPLIDILSPIELAKAGFFHVKDDDVQCAFCRVIIGRWEPGDDIMTEHRRHSPNCRFVHGESICNVPIETDPIVNSTKKTNNLSTRISKSKYRYNEGNVPIYSNYATLEARIESFNKPNWASEIDPRKLAEAGFFFPENERPVKSDRSRCYHCGGILNHWVESDDPIEEHVKFFPKCHFIMNKLTPDYTEFVQQRQLVIEQLNEKSNSLISKKYSEMYRNMKFENYLQIKQAATMLAQSNDLNDNDTTQTSHNSSFSFDNYQQSLWKHYLKKFSFFIDAVDIFNFLKPSDTTSSTSNENIDISVLREQNTTRNSSSSELDCSRSNNGFESDSGHSSSPESLEEEAPPINSNILKCTICCDKQIGIVFLPCGHQLACIDCANKLEKCPVCRTKITSKVRTYFCSI